MTLQHGGRVLIIKAKGGFGNRILSAATGVVIAELTGRTPVIDWRDGMYVPAGTNAYSLLFEAPTRIDPAQFDDRQDVVPRIWSGRLDQHPIDLVEEFFPSKHSSPFVYRRLSIDLAHPQTPEDVAVFWSYLPKMSRIRRLTRHSEQFQGRSDDEIIRGVLARHFQPNQRIRQTAEAVAQSWGGSRSIGVHVRYTDRKVPLPKIEAAVAELRARHPRSPIFLATDSAAVEDRLRDRFSQVSTIAKSFAQGASLHADGVFDDPIREAENALIDMWTLAKCHWLVHSSNSTFSVSAALIGSIPPERQTDVQRLDPRVTAKQWIQSWA